MDKRKENKGTLGNSGGRKSKAEEQKLIENLTPLHPKAMESFDKAISEGKDWAIKLFFNYFYGLPKQVIDQRNINIDAGKLTDDEIKKINNNLEQSY